MRGHSSAPWRCMWKCPVLQRPEGAQRQRGAQRAETSATPLTLPTSCERAGLCARAEWRIQGSLAGLVECSKVNTACIWVRMAGLQARFRFSLRRVPCAAFWQHTGWSFSLSLARFSQSRKLSVAQAGRIMLTLPVQCPLGARELCRCRARRVCVCLFSAPFSAALLLYFCRGLSVF